MDNRWWTPVDDLNHADSHWSKEFYPDGSGKWRLDVMSEPTRGGGRIFMGEVVIHGALDGALTLSIATLDEIP